MRSNAVLDEAFTRIPGVVRRTLDDIDPAALTWRVEPGANTIGWLVWHLTRIQDDHVAELAETDQVWLAEDWARRFGLSEATPETGYGHTHEQVSAIRPDGADALLGYLDRVTERTRDFLTTIGDDDLDRVVDRSWDPPVTMGVRLVSVIGDNLQHAGQAAYLRGVYDRTR
ncbi:MAG: DUF664 domain-containing protein [Nitriliruptoraceae bacterium]